MAYEFMISEHCQNVQGMTKSHFKMDTLGLSMKHKLY